MPAIRGRTRHHAPHHPAPARRGLDERRTGGPSELGTEPLKTPISRGNWLKAPSSASLLGATARPLPRVMQPAAGTPKGAGGAVLDSGVASGVRRTPLRPSRSVPFAGERRWDPLIAPLGSQHKLLFYASARLPDGTLKGADKASPQIAATRRGSQRSPSDPTATPRSGRFAGERSLPSLIAPLGSQHEVIRLREGELNSSGTALCLAAPPRDAQ
jgi:hypothetical protein